ncbi:MAG: hypothetical protein IAE91_00705 [Ignavibacteriaceae bacterium]|nr:hypothetical protein [Ignavibacteriaceae bacterium]
MKKNKKKLYIIYMLIFFPFAVMGQEINISSKLGLNTGQSAVIYIPKNFKPEVKGVDLLIHQHGLKDTVISNFNKAGVNGVLIALNLGSLSGDYDRKYFATKSNFTRLINVAKEEVEVNLRAKIEFKNIYLTAFSAGYGGVRAILRFPELFEMIKGTGLADGMYCDKDQDSIKVQLDPFIRFAAQALAGKKKFILTHSEVEAFDYFTAEKASELLMQKLGIAGNSDSSIDYTGTRIYSYESAKLKITGYKGDTGSDHFNHFLKISEIFRFLMKIERGE